MRSSYFHGTQALGALGALGALLVGACGQPGALDEADGGGAVSGESALTAPAFIAVADTTARSRQPGNNYASANLSVAGPSSAREAYVKFVVAGLPNGATVTSAKLRLFTTGQGDTPNGPRVYRSASTGWQERTLTWNNRPSVTGAVLANLGAVPADAWVSLDVTPAVTGNGTFSFTLVGDSDDLFEARSREDTQAPELVITHQPPAVDGGVVDAARVVDSAASPDSGGGGGGDVTPPAVAVSAPSGGVTVSGNAVAVSASASDAVGVAGVQFKLDGANLGSEDIAAPYSITWNSTLSANASHALTATARDAAGNSKTSAIVTVTVANGGGGGGGDLCAGLVTDKAKHAMTALAKPGLGLAAIDPQFGTTIRRISNAGAGNVIKPAYGTIPAWNADETYLVLYHTGGSVPGGGGHHLYNGKTYQHLRTLDIDPPDLEQFYWSSVDPDLMFYVDSSTNRLIRYHVGSNTKEALHTFACGGSISGGSDPMYMSWGSDVIGLTCDGSTMFTYRISSATESKRINGANSLAPQAAPSGALFFFAGGANSNVYDVNMNLLRTLPVEPENHASLGRLLDGTDTHNTVSFDSNTPGTLVVSNMSTGQARVVIGEATGYPYPPSGTHVSALAFQKPGWVAVSVVGDTGGQTVLSQELALANTNPGGVVCRVAHHRSYGKEGSMGYWAEPHVVISPSGTRVLFGSDWGNGGSVDAYVVELASYKP